MSFLSMYSELRGSVPKIPLALCKTLTNRAWRDIRRQNLWSFQIYDSNWISPGLVNSGLATAVQGSDQVVLDATAAAALIASNTSYSPVTLRQFRIGTSTVYNINAFDNVLTLTLDRGYQESSTGGPVAYNIYQCYYAAPYQDHLTFVSVRNMTFPSDLFLDKNREWLDEVDPQRTYWQWPTHVLFYRTGNDVGNMATYQYPMFEMWGPPLSNYSFQLYGIRKGTDLVANTDTLPPCIGEDAVIALAKVFGYEWAEANKGSLPRNQGPDFKFLMGESMAQYTRLYKDMRRQDRETVDSWFSIRRSSLYGRFWQSYNSINQSANPGAF